MSAVRIHQYGTPDAHAPSASGRAVDKMMLPAGTP